MNHFPFFFAEVSEFVDVVSVQRNMLTSGLSQFSIVMLALLAVVLISFIGVFIFRKQLLRRKHRHHHRKSNGVVSGRNGHGSEPVKRNPNAQKRPPGAA